MSLSHEQLQEINKYQEKFINGEMTKQEYEIAKSDILSWDFQKDSTTPIKKIRLEDDKKLEDENFDGDFLMGVVIFVSHVFALLQNIIVGVYRGFQHIHKWIVWMSKTRWVSLWKVYGSICVIVGIVWLSVFGMNNYFAYQVRAEEQAASEKKIAEQKIEDEKKQLILEEKAKTPIPKIDVTSSIENQWTHTGYTLVFRVESADTVTVNGVNISGSGGIYKTSIELSQVETPITIQTKNKYFSDEKSFLITRSKTPEEINAEKLAEQKVIEEEKRQAEEEQLALKKEADDKRQALEEEKKTYSPIAYAKLSKNPEKYKGERIRFKWEIFGADEEGTNGIFQINTDGYGYDDQIMTFVDWSNDYVKWDWVTVYGVISGEHCYTSQAGWNICVPLVKANIIE